MSRAVRPRRLLDAWADPLAPEGAGAWAAAAFVVLVLLATLHDLGTRSLHDLDLPRFGSLAREMIESGEWLVPLRDAGHAEPYVNKPPLLIWLVAAPSALVGEVTPFLVRLPSAVGWILVVAFAAAWGRWRTGCRRTGRLAALLLLGTYAMSRYGRESRPDMLGTGLATAAAALLDRAAMGGAGRAAPWGAGLLLGLALLAKGPPLLVVPLLVLLVPSPGRGVGARIRGARLPLTLGVALGVAACWFVPAVLHGGWESYGRPLLLEQVSSRLAGGSNHGEAAGYYALRILDATVPWTPLYVVPVVALLAARGRRALGSTLGLVVAALVALAVFSAVPTKSIRYVLPVLPPLALAGAAIVRGGLDARGRGERRRVVRAGGAAALLSGAGLMGAAAFVPSAAVPLAPLAAGLGLLGLGLLAAPPPPAVRRRLLGGALVAVVLLLAGYWVVRHRHRVRDNEAMNRAVAAVLVAHPDVPVYTLEPVTPEHVFHGAPGAAHALEPANLPSPATAPRLLVLAEAEQRPAVEAARGGPGRVLLEHHLPKTERTLLLLGFEPR